MTDSYEQIIRKTVEGQIASFLNDHPYIADSVRRHKGVRKTQRQWLIGSLAKRIVRDLTCGNTTARLAEALCNDEVRPSEESRRGTVSCDDKRPSELAADG